MQSAIFFLLADVAAEHAAPLQPGAPESDYTMAWVSAGISVCALALLFLYWRKRRAAKEDPDQPH